MIQGPVFGIDGFTWGFVGLCGPLRGYRMPHLWCQGGKFCFLLSCWLKTADFRNMVPHHLAMPLKSQEHGKSNKHCFKRRSCFRALLLKENDNDCFEYLSFERPHPTSCCGVWSWISPLDRWLRERGSTYASWCNPPLDGITVNGCKFLVFQSYLFEGW